MDDRNEEWDDIKHLKVENKRLSEALAFMLKIFGNDVFTGDGAEGDAINKARKALAMRPLPERSEPQSVGMTVDKRN